MNEVKPFPVTRFIASTLIKLATVFWHAPWWGKCCLCMAALLTAATWLP